MPKPTFDLNEYLSNALKSYPQDARDLNIGGRVVVRFRINEYGDVDSAYVEKPVYPSIDSTAISVVMKMPKWEPGEQEGTPVKVYYTLRLNFKTGNEIEKIKKKRRRK